MPEKSLYEKLGIDPDKSTVREIFGAIVHNDFPGAFVNIARDPDLPGVVFTSHSDGDGSKFIQRLLHYLETGDESIFQGSVDDAFSMNTGDIAASGFTSGLWAITQTIACNAFNVPKEIILRQIALRIVGLLDLYRRYGFDLNFFMGGETADLPDQVNSMVLDMNITARESESNLIRGNVQTGDVMFGFASDGQAIWEEVLNSGLMSNGLTLGRICLMAPVYSGKYPFLVRSGGNFTGRFDVDSSSAELGMTVSEAILSPTRQWAIVIKLIIERLKKMDAFNLLHGISMNTGGGATKIQHVGQGIIYKKNMPKPPPIFQLIREESGENWRNMFKSFNSGIGIDVVGSPDGNILRDCLMAVSEETGIQLYGELGVCEASKTKSNKVILETPYGTFDDY